MTIRSKMLLTLAVVICLMTTGALIIDSQTKQFGQLKEGQTAVSRLETDILSLRKHEKDFLHRKDTKYLKRFATKHQETDAKLSQLIDLLDGITIESADVTSIQQEIQEYATKFKSLAEYQIEIGLDENSGLYGNLRNAVHGAEAWFKDSSNFELLAHMLMLRRIEKDFMLRRDMNQADKFEQHYRTFQSALSEAYLTRQERAKIQRLTEKYRTAFLELIDAEQKIGLTQQVGLLGDLRETIHAVEEHFTSLSSVVDSEMQVIEKRLTWTLYVMVGFITLMIAGLLLLLGTNILRRIRHATENMQQIAVGDGDLTRRLDETGNDEIANLACAFNLFANKIHDTLKKSAELITGLGQIGDRVANAASSTDASMIQLRANTHSVVTATEELSATARDVASNASQVSVSTQQANQLASEGRNMVDQSIQSINSFATEFNQAATTIASLHSETENIGSILDVIRSIAEQTNLLALNAAIEAARAGEQGRGFAVVADEVRSLAHRSQESTNEIQELIERLQSQAASASVMIQQGHERISGTVAEAEQTGVALYKITESVGSITDMTTQIATAAEEQSMVVNEINQNVISIDGLSKDTARNADDTTHLSADLAQAMAEVVKEIQQFHFENDEKMVLEQAKTAHLAWKARLREFLDGKAHLTREQAVSHHECDLGRWYDNQGKKRFGHLSEFKAIEAPHEQIHTMIKEVVSLQGKGDKTGAEKAFKQVASLSEKIVKQLDALTKAVK